MPHCRPANHAYSVHSRRDAPCLIIKMSTCFSPLVTLEHRKHFHYEEGNKPYLWSCMKTLSRTSSPILYFMLLWHRLSTSYSSRTKDPIPISTPLLQRDEWLNLLVMNNGSHALAISHTWWSHLVTSGSTVLSFKQILTVIASSRIYVLHIISATSRVLRSSTNSPQIPPCNPGKKEQNTFLGGPFIEHLAYSSG